MDRSVIPLFKPAPERQLSRPLPRQLASVLCLHDFEALARKKLPRPLYGFIAGAAEDNRSLNANLGAFSDHHFVPRVLVDVSARSQACSIFGKTYAAPFGLSPVGISSFLAYEGDLVLAAAAQQANVPAIMSGTSLVRMEEVAAQSPRTWFQAYLPGDTARIAPLIDRIAGAGFGTLVLTVDIPVWANRENNVRAGFSTPLRPSLRLAWDGMTHPRWLVGTLARTLLKRGMPHFENSFATRGAAILSRNAVRDTTGRDHLNWADIAAIRRKWKGPLVIKGILSTADALRARQTGADGIIVSNHGGRQLDGAVPALKVLPRIVDAVPALPVMIDGGFRRGGDVLKALALGATCAFAGRPFIYAAVVGGEPGVARAISLLRDEIDRNMAMLGVNALKELDRSYLMSPC
jgi:L-lactate dehydrogenase (cytochrome)